MPNPKQIEPLLAASSIKVLRFLFLNEHLSREAGWEAGARHVAVMESPME